MIKKFEAFINKEGELKDFTHDLVFYQGNAAFIYKNHKLYNKTEYRIYGDFTYTDDAQDMESGHKVYQAFPGFISYNTINGRIHPNVKKGSIFDIYDDDDFYDLDDLCHNVVAEIFA